MKSIIKTFINKALLEYKVCLLETIKEITLLASSHSTLPSNNQTSLSRLKKPKIKSYKDSNSGGEYSFSLSETPTCILTFLPHSDEATFSVKMLYYIDQLICNIYSIDRNYIFSILVLSLCLNVYLLSHYSSPMISVDPLDGYFDTHMPIYDLLNKSSYSGSLGGRVDKAREMIFNISSSYSDDLTFLAEKW